MAGEVTQGLRDKVRARLGQWSVAGVLDADIYLFLQRGQVDLGWWLRDAALVELTGTTSGTLTNSRVGLPTDFWRERLLQIGEAEVEAKRWNVSDVKDLQGNELVGPSADNPYYFIWYDLTDTAVRLKVDIDAPTSTAAYALEHLKVPAAPNATRDPVLNAAYHDLMVDFAVACCLESVRRYREGEAIRRARLDKIGAVSSHYAPGPLQQGVPGDI